MPRTNGCAKTRSHSAADSALTSSVKCTASSLRHSPSPEGYSSAAPNGAEGPDHAIRGDTDRERLSRPGRPRRRLAYRNTESGRGGVPVSNRSAWVDQGSRMSHLRPARLSLSGKFGDLTELDVK